MSWAWGVHFLLVRQPMSLLCTYPCLLFSSGWFSSTFHCLSAPCLQISKSPAEWKQLGNPEWGGGNDVWSTHNMKTFALLEEGSLKLSKDWGPYAVGFGHIHYNQDTRGLKMWCVEWNKKHFVPSGWRLWFRQEVTFEGKKTPTKQVPQDRAVSLGLLGLYLSPHHLKDVCLS